MADNNTGNNGVNANIGLNPSGKGVNANIYVVLILLLRLRVFYPIPRTGFWPYLRLNEILNYLLGKNALLYIHI